MKQLVLVKQLHSRSFSQTTIVVERVWQHELTFQTLEHQSMADQFDATESSIYLQIDASSNELTHTWSGLNRLNWAWSANLEVC